MEPTKEAQAQLIEQEITIWNNTLYMYQLRHRVNKKLGNIEACQQLESDMVKVEQALDELEAIKKELG